MPNVLLMGCNACSIALVLGIAGCHSSASNTPAEPKGWELDETNTGLAGVGIDPSSLALYTGDAKPAAGTVISEKRIETLLDLSNGSITIERCWVHPTSGAAGINLITTYDNNIITSTGPAPAPAAVAVRDSDLDGTGISDDSIVAYSAAFGGNGTVERCNIKGMGSGIAIWRAGSSVSGVVQGNYIHGLRAYGNPATTGSHSDGLTVRDYSGPRLTVNNNRIDCSSGNDTGAVFIQPYSGYIDNVLVSGNLLEGNGYQLILERNSYDYGTSMRATDNRFSGTGYGPGYVDPKGLTYGWSEWTNNYLNDSSKTDNEGTIVEEEGP